MSEPLPPIYLATAVEAVLRAGDVQMQHFGGAMQVDKKGAIDLVTNIDVQVEREFRAMIAERFPDHAVLGEEFVEAGQQEQFRLSYDQVEALLDLRDLPADVRDVVRLYFLQLIGQLNEAKPTE